jgi:hypothetical protein
MTFAGYYDEQKDEQMAIINKRSKDIDEMIKNNTLEDNCYSLEELFEKIKKAK